MEVNPATTSTLKRSAFHIREFPRFTVGHFLVVKLTTVRRWRGKPPKKNHITGTPSQKKMWPPQKKISWKWWSYIPEWKKPGKPRCSVLRFFRFFFGCFWVERSCLNDVVGSMTSGPILRKMLPFWKVGGSNLSQKMPTLYIIKWWHDSSPTKGSHTDFKDS